MHLKNEKISKYTILFFGFTEANLLFSIKCIFADLKKIPKEPLWN